MSPEPQKEPAMTLRWFNVGAPAFRIGKRGPLVVLWNLFNHHTNTGEHWWGAGLLQVGNRHLFYVGYSGVSLLFIGRTP